jgi:hypothetical protein
MLIIWSAVFWLHVALEVIANMFDDNAVSKFKPTDGCNIDIYLENYTLSQPGKLQVVTTQRATVLSQPRETHVITTHKATRSHNPESYTL